MAEGTDAKPAAGGGGGTSQQQEEAPRPPGIIGLCLGCLCCLLCSPLLICCCCCSGAHSAVQKAQGKRWDAKQHKWVIDNLEEDAETLKNIPNDDDDILKQGKIEQEVAEEATAATESAAVSQVKETAYYEALGVSPDADEKMIKKAYYVNARKWHPDRNDSEEAKEKFQKIGEAYQVLSDPKLRAVYDKEGEAGLSGDRTEVSPEKLDPSLVFTFLFGSDAFDAYVGRLQLVTQIMSEETKISREQFMELERRRVIRLALKLKDRVQPYVEGQEETAKAAWKEEAERLVEVRYGEEILNTVGSTYKLVATQCIGSWGEGMEAQVDEMKMKQGAAKAAYAGAQDMQKNQGAEGEVGEDKLPTYIGMMWNVTVIDISSTLREVVMKCVSDRSVEDDVRKKRAEAIKVLGEMFEKQKSKKQKRDMRSVRGLYQSAAQAAMEKTLNEMREEDEKAAAKAAET